MEFYPFILQKIKQQDGLKEKADDYIAKFFQVHVKSVKLKCNIANILL